MWHLSSSDLKTAAETQDALEVYCSKNGRTLMSCGESISNSRIQKLFFKTNQSIKKGSL